MKILLLFPGWTGEYGIFAHFAKAASIWPPLNLGYLAAIAQRDGHQVRLIDAEAERLSLAEVIKEALAFEPDIVGITATTPFYHLAAEAAAALKAEKIRAPVVIGGQHISVLKEKAFKDCFDYAFIAESDESWPLFLRRYAQGQDISDIKGILFRKNGNIIFTGMPEPVKDIDAIPFPARRLLKMGRYRIGTLRGRKNFTTILAIRGCPYKCIFCSTEVFGKRIRRRSVDSLIEEIKSVISDFNIRHFIFADETLTLDRNYILQFCEKIQDEKTAITFECNARADLVDEGLISAMAKAGLIRISFGLETVDEDMRRIMKKEVPLASYAQANRITNKYGVETLNSVMLGLPGETRQTAEKTLSYLRHSREIHQANFSIATPYPGTELYEMAKKGEHGLKLLSEDFSQYRRYGSAVISVNDLSREDLIRLQNDGFVRIYSAPWRIIPMLRKNGISGGALMLFRLAGFVWRRIFCWPKNRCQPLQQAPL
jgi:radical SAM superfamily enzyme YgiQ (UPF0313 family)